MSRARFLLKRGLQGIFVVWGVVTVVFLLRFITPGDPVALIAPLDASPELRQQIAENLGLNRPLYVQYLDYVGGLFVGDMGYSYVAGTSVSNRVFARLPATIELAAAATIASIASPPARSTVCPLCAARWCGAVTMPLGADGLFSMGAPFPAE